MRKDMRNIGSLYKNRFENFEQEVESSDWSELAYKLEKSEFYKFNLTKFNVYYSTLIVLTFVFSLCVFVKHIILKEDQFTENASIQKTESPAVSLGSGLSREENKSSAEVISKNNNTIGPDKNLDNGLFDTKPKNKLIIKADTQVKHDTIHLFQKGEVAYSDTLIRPKTQVVDSIAKPVRKPKDKKIVYVTRRDTIIQYDTVKVMKRKKTR